MGLASYIAVYSLIVIMKNTYTSEQH